MNVSATMGQKPTVTFVAKDPPTTLFKKDVVVGTGPEAQNGTSVNVQYVGIAWSNQKEFDASWNRGQPFPFQLPGQVIQGWNEGIPGMKVGGRRLLVIPPDKGYGAQGAGGVIGPNETLVFVVDLLNVSGAPSASPSYGPS